MTYSIVPAQDWHLDYVTLTIRKEDAEELYAASGRIAKECIGEAKGLCDIYTWLCDDVPLAVFGVVDRGDGIGNPWAIFTCEARKHKYELARSSQFVINILKRDFALLYNYVDDRNSLAIRWLKWLGFRMSEPLPYGPFGCMFRLFDWRSDV